MDAVVIGDEDAVVGEIALRWHGGDPFGHAAAGAAVS